MIYEVNDDHIFEIGEQMERNGKNGHALQGTTTYERKGQNIDLSNKLLNPCSGVTT